MQKMVYEEMVPALFGNSLDKFDNGSLRPSNRPINQNHDRTGPVIFNEFATAAFRYGHSQQPETIVTKDGQYRVQSTDDIRDNFFDPHVLIQQGPAAICRGAATLQGLSTGPAFGDSVLHNLFKPHGGDFGIDLFAINIARGRDHGLESHKKYLKKFQEDPECADLYRGWRGMRPEWNALVRDQFRNRDWEVDLYVGILMEKHLDGAAIGPTGACIIGKQFKTLKTQDRWFYENQEFWNDEAKFDQVKKIDLATTMCLTLGDTMKRVPDMPFIADGFPLDGKTRKMVNCNNLMNRLDLSEIYGEPEEPTSPPTEPPTEPPRPENEPICDFDPVDRVVDCSNRGFDSMSLELMAERLRRTHAYPVDVNVHGGKERRQVKSDAVRIINLSGNPGLKSSDKGVFFLAIKEFNFARTLDIRNTNLDISKNEIHQHLPHIRQSFV